MAAAINVIDAASVARALTEIRVIDPNGADRVLTQINVIDAGSVDRIVWGPASATLAVSVTPASVSGASRSSTITSGISTASASGGTGPYTYSWALTAHNNITAPVANAPSSVATNFTQSNIGFNEEYTATFTVTVTDSVLATATTTVSVTWTNNSGDGGGNCVADDTLTMFANGALDGPGEIRPFRPGDEGRHIWTQHEITREWGAYRILELRFVKRPVFKSGDLPRASERHRFALDDWTQIETIGEPDGDATVVEAIIEDAHTYMSKRPDLPDAPWVLSHNIKLLP